MMVGKCLSSRSCSFSQDRNDCWLPHRVLGNFKQELSDQWPKPRFFLPSLLSNPVCLGSEGEQGGVCWRGLSPAVMAFLRAFAGTATPSSGRAAVRPAAAGSLCFFPSSSHWGRQRRLNKIKYTADERNVQSKRERSLVKFFLLMKQFIFLFSSPNLQITI